MTMLTFRHRMTSPEEIAYLQCKICNKEFPRYDQRGFRNAGFTAHQNRCIERECLLKNPVVEQTSPSNKQRLLLPAPSSSINVPISNAGTYLTFSSSQQQEPKTSIMPNQSETFTFVIAQPPQPPSIDLSLFSNVNRYPLDMIPSSFELNMYNHSEFLEHVSETVFPITQCDYCMPKHGLHQPNCLLLANIVSQGPSDFPPI